MCHLLVFSLSSSLFVSLAAPTPSSFLPNLQYLEGARTKSQPDWIFPVEYLIYWFSVCIFIIPMKAFERVKCALNCMIFDYPRCALIFHRLCYKILWWQRYCRNYFHKYHGYLEFYSSGNAEISAACYLFASQPSSLGHSSFFRELVRKDETHAGARSLSVLPDAQKRCYQYVFKNSQTTNSIK